MRSGLRSVTLGLWIVFAVAFVGGLAVHAAFREDPPASESILVLFIWLTPALFVAYHLVAGADTSGPDLFQPIVGRGSAYADIDGDGDLDVVLTQVAGPPMLLRNDLAPGRRWLRLKLTGTKSNRDAIGAWVTVRSAGRTMARQVMPARSYLSQSELPVTFGLGENDPVEDVAILWPDGSRQAVASPPANRLVVIEQER